MTIEEYQTIKLIDLEGLTQEECWIMEIEDNVQGYTWKLEKTCNFSNSPLKIEGGNFSYVK